VLVQEQIGENDNLYFTTNGSNKQHANK